MADTWAKSELCIQDLPLGLHDVPPRAQEHICLFIAEHVRQSSLSTPYSQASETTNTAVEALKWEGDLILTIGAVILLDGSSTSAVGTAVQWPSGVRPDTVLCCSL